MLTRIKSSLFIVSAVTIFVLASWMISTSSVETLALFVDEQPANITNENVSVAAEPVRPQQPSMAETIQQASLNWADYAEVSTPESASPQSSMAETIRQASLNWADYAEVSTPESASPQSSMAETIRQASLNWADYSNVIEVEGNLPEPNYDTATEGKPH